MGNRGGRLHDDKQKLGRRRWTSKQWICCKLEFNNRHRAVWGDSYTELFFLDEVTAFAAGHRPCFECRRKDAERFAALFRGGGGVDQYSAHSRESGNPGGRSKTPVYSALDPRFRGDERRRVRRATAAAMDAVLHVERLAGTAKRAHSRKLDTLPDGAMIALADQAYAVRGWRLLRWSPAGYSQQIPRRPAEADVLTPPSILNVLARGYTPLWHASAD